MNETSTLDPSGPHPSDASVASDPGWLEWAERILIVDDDPALHEDIRGVLEGRADGSSLRDLERLLFGDALPGEGAEPLYAIDSAFSGEEGRDRAVQAIAEGRPFSLAFVDLRMPGWSGLETVAALWAVDADLEIVVCTAFTDDGLAALRTSGREGDQLLVLKKPFDAMEVRQLARSLSVKRRMRAQALSHLQSLEAMVAERTKELEATLLERDRLDVELRNAQKIEAVGQLAAGIAHEINTPVQYIGDSIYFLKESFADLSGLIESLKALALAGSIEPEASRTERVAEAEDAADYEYLVEHIPQALDRASSGVAQVAEIVSAMREFAHPDQKEKSFADLNHIIENALTVAKASYKLVADISAEFGELPDVPLLVGEIGQVFLNLLVNAAHAIEDKVGDSGERGTIGIRTELEDDKVLITFSDTGAGIPDEIVHRVFDPFFTTKEVGKGTGQGLAIAHSCITDKHGGSLSVESEPGVGTTFHIRLPLEQRERAS